MHVRPSALTVLAVVLLAGCSDPYSRPAATATTATTATTAESPLARAERTGEYAAPSTPGPEPRGRRTDPAASGPAATAAIEAFADLYVNWTAETVAAHLETLARRSTGQASKDMALAAQRSRSDYELHRGGVYNRGTIRAIAPDRGRAGRYVVVTLESTGAKSHEYEGLKPAYHVTLAEVRRTKRGWTVSSWQPQT